MQKEFTAEVAVFWPRSQEEYWRASRANHFLSDHRHYTATPAVNPFTTATHSDV